MLRDEPRAKGERPALGHVIAPFKYIRSISTKKPYVTCPPQEVNKLKFFTIPSQDII